MCSVLTRLGRRERDIVRRWNAVPGITVRKANVELIESPDSSTRWRPARRWILEGEEENMLGTILIVLLVFFLVGALPTWNHSRSWGYFPSGGMGLLLVIVIFLLLLGRI